MRRWIYQPYNTNLCGQIAVAVVAGISLEKSIELFGKQGCTRTKELVKVLRQIGFECPDKLQRKRTNLCIAKLTYPNKRSHWIVMDGDKIFDGCNGNEHGSVTWNSDWKVTSYLPITKI